jgi:hypothetical protein
MTRTELHRLIDQIVKYATSVDPRPITKDDAAAVIEQVLTDIRKSAAMVGCETHDGLIITHTADTTCVVCSVQTGEAAKS